MNALAAYAPADAEDQAFVLSAGGLPWAVAAADVQTIFRVGAITRVPLAPPLVAGLVNLRGRVVLAISLAQRLFGAAMQPGAAPPPFGVAVEHGDDIFAFLVEDVGEVLPLAAADRVPLPPHAPPEFTRFTSACFRTARGTLPLLAVAPLVDLDTDRRSGRDRRTSFVPHPGEKP